MPRLYYRAVVDSKDKRFLGFMTHRKYQELKNKNLPKQHEVYGTILCLTDFWQYAPTEILKTYHTKNPKDNYFQRRIKGNIHERKTLPQSEPHGKAV